MTARRVAAGATVALVALAACAAPRNAIGTRSSACFRALPTAMTAVHHHGHLVGVRKVSRATLLHAVPQPNPPDGRDFCVVGFSGPYRSQDVERPSGPAAGRYAMVAVTTRGTDALRTYLVDHLPLRLRH